MNKKQFTKIIKGIIRQNKAEEELLAIRNKYNYDNPYRFEGRLLELVVEALQLAMNDTDDWIGYYLWECNYGRNKKMLRSVKIDGKIQMPNGTIRELYDLIKYEKKVQTVQKEKTPIYLRNL